MSIITYICSTLVGENLQRYVEIPGECLEENIEFHFGYVEFGKLWVWFKLEDNQIVNEYAQKIDQNRGKNRYLRHLGDIHRHENEWNHLGRENMKQKDGARKNWSIWAE